MRLGAGGRRSQPTQPPRRYGGRTAEAQSVRWIPVEVEGATVTSERSSIGAPSRSAVSPACWPGMGHAGDCADGACAGGD
jgi:hypothetical protein